MEGSLLPSFEQSLHDAAGLTTQADVFAHGCTENAFGVTSRSGAYLGTTSQSLMMFAAWGYDPILDSNVLFSGSVSATSFTEKTFNEDSSSPTAVTHTTTVTLTVT